MKKIILAIVIVSIIFLIPFQAKAEVDISQPVIANTEQEIVELKIALMKQLIELLQQLIVMIQSQQISATSIQVIEPVVEPTSSVTQIEPVVTSQSIETLTFTQTPKLIFREGRLARVTWQTNRPTTLVVSPVFPEGDGWTTKGGAWDSCGRMNVSFDINSACRIVVKDIDGNQIEHTLHVFVDNIQE